MNLVGFVRWHFRGCFANLTFWGFLCLAVATMLMMFSASTTLIMTVAVMGAGLVILDAGISWFRLSYSMYEDEQTRIARELERK